VIPLPTLANRLSKLRKENKKTQQQVADYLKITRPAYTAYEGGNRQPDYDTLQKLADYFNTTTDYLLGRVEDPSKNIKKPEQIDDPAKLVDDPILGLWFKAGKESSAANRQRALEFLEFLEREEKGRKSRR
jgi:transcriptional regulator with XRE-family HTH domain